MKPRYSLSIATWFLNQFGSLPENESAIGDLFELCQRNPGAMQYWRQVLAIAYGGLYREFRRKKFRFLGELLRIWLIAVGLDLFAGFLLIWRYRSIHGYGPGAGHGLTASPYPLLTLRVVMGNQRPDQWDVSLLSVLLNILLPILLGWVIASSATLQSRAVLLAYTTLFIFATSLFALASSRMVVENQTNAAGFLIAAIAALPVVPTLTVIGAGLSRNKSKEHVLEGDA
jgi:hypothetical protein